MLAVEHKLDNLVCIVDYNQSQIRSLPLSNLKNKFQSFGCNSIETNGHNIKEIIQSLINTKENMPTFVIANTIKGKGISQLESNMFTWHHKAPTLEEYTQFIQEIYEN
jgi:transketolase